MTTPSEQIIALVLDRGLLAGELTVVGRDGSERTYTGSEPGPSARIEYRTPRAARRTIMGAALGMAEGYLEGDWDTPDLDALLALGLANFGREPNSRTTLLTPFARAFHSLRDNDLGGSKRNIEYHYDLGNDFYRLWLDPTMAYSSALYPGSCPTCDDEDLSVAQVRKWNRLLDELQPGTKDHLLEIGCGWGGFAIHAAKESGCRVTGVTLSEAQHAWATRAVAEEGLEGRVDLRLQDYRHVPETYTGIASIEMFEAVGEKWWPVFFTRIKELLAPGGAAAIQVITIEDHRYEDYRDHPDFIQRYIFPGGMLPSPERFAAAAQACHLSFSDPHFFGRSYSATLSEWSRRFEAALPEVRALGFDDRFIRMWRYYLAYCKAGFEAGTIDVMQVRLEG